MHTSVLSGPRWNMLGPLSSSPKKSSPLFIADIAVYHQCYINCNSHPWRVYRQIKARLSLFYKAMNNLIALQIPQYYQTHHIDTRLHHQSSAPLHILTFKHHHNYVNIFFPKTINEWNTFVATSDSLVTFQYNI